MLSVLFLPYVATIGILIMLRLVERRNRQAGVAVRARRRS
jgi:hypothetical protein